MTKVYGRSMVEIPRSEWPITGMFETEPLRVWRSADYLAVLYRQWQETLHHNHFFDCTEELL